MDPENLQKPWSTEAILDLLDKVRRHEVLWKIKHPQYHKKSMKRSIFDQICKELKMEHPDLYLMTTDDVIGKFAYLRGHFQKQLRKISSPSVSGRKRSSRWEYFQACSFLRPVYENCKSEATFQLPDANDGRVMYDRSLELRLATQDNLLVGSLDPTGGNIAPGNSNLATVAQNGNVSPSTMYASLAMSTSPHSCTTSPPNKKKRKEQDTLEHLNQKIMLLLDAVNAARSAHSQAKPYRFDPATESVMSVMANIPDSFQHLKNEFTEKVLFLSAEVMQKYYRERRDNW
ncbi:hypothetical protein Pmani_037974 [Petrolisthes manimaculis]|uniref:MADF domain-containing protein n=1 Tax=Petrolisthes manimaculis TaxID=1843537 RepID=A0AAE1TKX3_9EUCA|nr:hypothetical protein Pmani_037974 [Petrolisthes manimaculis]